MFTEANPVERKDKRQNSHRNLMATRARLASLEVADIGNPPQRNEKRWKRYRTDLLRFLVECFPHTTGLKPFSPAHKDIIYRIQKAALEGGLFLQIVYRGFAKSTITENAVIWATGYGHSKFVVPIAADASAAQIIVDSIQAEIETNPDLMEIFPEVCHCAQQLEGTPQRAGKQHIAGEKTNIQWPSSHCVYPTLEGFAGSGAIITPKGITASIRGLRFKRPDGEQVRPDFVLIDDPQTDESAASPSQVNKRLSKLNKAILRLGGHRKQIAVVCNATVIEAGDMIDQLADHDKNPIWQTERVPMLMTRATNEQLWTDDYATIRTSYDPDDKDDQTRAHRAATRFYRKNMRRMNAGAKASWRHCFSEATELSAIQHAYNILIDTGEEAFACECQSEPLVDQTGMEMLGFDGITRKQSGYPRGVVPAEATTLVAMIDVHPELLYYEVWAYGMGFAGYKIDGGNYPHQKRLSFKHQNPPHPLSKKFPGMDQEAAIFAGLDVCTEEIIGREWGRSDGVPMRIVRCLVDANGNESTVIRSFCRQSKYAAILIPSFGKGITAKNAPISRWEQVQGKGYGPEWAPTKPKAGETTGVIFDSNYWKTRFHRQLALPKGSKSSLYVYKASQEDHQFASQAYCAEMPVEVQVGSRIVQEWQIRPSQENHQLDCAVGCMVAASIAGISNRTPEPRKKTKPKRKKVRYADA